MTQESMVNADKASALTPPIDSHARRAPLSTEEWSTLFSHYLGAPMMPGHAIASATSSGVISNPVVSKPGAEGAQDGI